MHALFLAILAGVLAASASITDYTFDNGQARLLGSSFGVPGTNATFDYVIVGGGTAGLTVAARLTENPAISVAVIEAGGFYELDNGNISQIPAYAGRNTGSDPSQIQSSVDWGIVTVPQKQLGNRSLAYTKGKCLGGSSARNVLAFHRGTKGSYQRWATTVSDPTFTFPSLLPFFKKSATLTPPNASKRGPGSEVTYDPSAFLPTNEGGPLQASYPNFYQPISPSIKHALQSLGFKEIPGFNSGDLLGFSEFTYTIDPRATTRGTAETAFLQPNLNRGNMIVHQRRLAKGLLFNGTKVATGVAVESFGKGFVLQARKEVIVSAGAFRTPQLLLASGIGPKSTLDQLGISVRAESPGVGQNLRVNTNDQPLFSITFKVNVPTNSELTTNKTAASQAVRDYLTTQSGRLSSGSNNWIAWDKLPPSSLQNLTDNALTSLPDDWPHLEILPSAATTLPIPINDTSQYASILVALSAATSIGTVTINSTDLAQNPVIDPNWLETEVDQAVAVAALKRIREIRDAMGGVVAGEEVAPGKGVVSDEEILEYVRRTVTTFHHAVGTCKMGRDDDSDAVVTTKGLVKGVERLRVVDASIFPILPPGHTQATVYALAEKIAVDILNAQ